MFNASALLAKVTGVERRLKFSETWWPTPRFHWDTMWPGATGGTMITTTRRELLAALGVATLAKGASAKTAPTSPVAIARCRSYNDNLEATLDTMFDQIGGIGSLVKGKTVALKLNLTGNPKRFPVRADLPYRNSPETVLATVHLLARAGAKRVRILESFFPASQDMDLWGRYGLDIQAINNVCCKVEWENVQNLGLGS